MQIQYKLEKVAIAMHCNWKDTWLRASPALFQPTL